MMELRELGGFLKRRWGYDTLGGFACRVARLGLLSCPMAVSRLKMLRVKGNGYRYVVKNIWGSDMLLSADDRGIGTDLLLWGKREPLICEKFRGLLKEGMVVCDIGANVGYYALQESLLVGATGKVYAVEPIPENKRILDFNIALNGYKNIDVFELAMGEASKVEAIRVSEMSNLSTMVDKSGYRQYQGSIPVKVETVDRFLSDKLYPDVVRMDTEGYEVNIINGMTALLESGRPLLLFIEVHFDMLRESVIPMLRKLRHYGFGVKCASFETHPMVQKSPILPVVQLLEKGMGATGYVDVTIDDLINKRCFRSGQVENLEVIFERR